MDFEKPLSDDYYLKNFNRLLRHARNWYQDLLSEHENQWIESFQALDRESQCLLVRLYSRKGHYFRSDKLNYSEITKISHALSQLENRDFIAINPSITERDLGQYLLTKSELTRVFPHLSSSLKKQQMIEALHDVPFEQNDLLNFTIVELHNASMIDMLLALFFANTHQDLTQFVLEDLGLNKFERYQLSNERRFFTRRQQLDQLLLLGRIVDDYWHIDRKQPDELHRLVNNLPPEIDHPYVERKRQHLINDIARDLERLEQYSQAIELFSLSQLPPSRERQARIYDKLDQNETFRDIVTQILTQPHDLSEYEVGQRLQMRLLRKQGHKLTRAKKPTHQQQHLLLDLRSQRVELAVKEHFEKLGWQVYFTENTLLNGLLGLAIWDAVFAPVEGAFINQYQFKPLDLYHADFCTKRSDCIAHALDSVAQQNYQFIFDTYQQKMGISNPFITWSSLPEKLLKLALNAIPSDMLVELFKIQLSDLKLYRNGMPDLIAFKDGKFKWVEVKGPGDKLQDNQLRWIKHFERLAVPFSVCYVTQEKTDT